MAVTLRQSDPGFEARFSAFLAAKREAPKRKLWNFYDYHFSPRGHEVLAGELVSLLSELRQARASR